MGITIDQLIETLLDDRSIWDGPDGRINYPNNFLNNVAEVFEMRGLSQARLYVCSRSGYNEKAEKEGMLKILDYITRCPVACDDPPVGRMLIKNLNNLKRLQKGGR